jgi:AbrB family looped-hinge helix DNA binding protein
MEAAITKLSSKGQIVIPTEMRKNLHEGDKLLIIKNKDQFILKKASNLNLKEDLEFAKRTEEAWKRIEEGKGTKMDSEEFLKDLDKW